MMPVPAPYFDDWARNIYLNEVGWHCEFAEYAIGLYEQDLPSDGRNGYLNISFAVHALLSAFANLSKLFDPNKERNRRQGDTDEIMSWREHRGKSLRILFEVANDSPLMNRKMRNSFEHIAEYLDRWIVAQPRPTADELETTGYPERPSEPLAPLRLFNLTGNTVTFQEHSVDLAVIAREVRRVYSILQTLEPDSASQNRSLMAALSLLPAFPPELRLTAPTRRPIESVLSGVNLPTGPTWDQASTNAFELPRRDQNNDPTVDHLAP
jgi:hypothetical protein